MDSVHYVDLGNGEREPMSFFLLNALLQSRMETGHESNGDEEVNVYIAGLLHSLVDGRFYANNANLLATSPLDVQEKADQSDARGKARVYRTNADHRLVAFGLFGGDGNRISRYHQAVVPEQAEANLEHAAEFYAWAALFAARLPSKYRGLALTLGKLGARFDTYRLVLTHMAANHLDLLARITPGQLFHLERDANAAAQPAIEEHALDRMLDAYNHWKANPTAETRQALLEASATYGQFKPGFDPQSMLKGDTN